MSRSVAQKMGIKEGARAFFVNAPDVALKTIDLPELEVSEDLEGDFDYIHLSASPGPRWTRPSRSSRPT